MDRHLLKHIHNIYLAIEAFSIFQILKNMLMKYLYKVSLEQENCV